jgi:hypothetical protein
MRQNIWVLWHVLIALAAAGSFAYLVHRKRPLAAAAIVAGCCTTFIFVRTTMTAWKTTALGADHPSFSSLAPLIEHKFPATRFCSSTSARSSST